MRQNFNLNKRKREEAKKKKRDEKMAKRLGQKNAAPPVDPVLPDTQEIPPQE